MTRVAALALLPLWVGATLVLAELRVFRRPPLAERLGPYHPTTTRPTRAGLWSVGSLREVLGPLATELGERTARLFGVTERLERRLRRLQWPVSATEYRLRQLGWATLALGAGFAVALSARPPLAVDLLLCAGGPLLAFLALEQHVAAASAAHQRRLFLELPVVTEQLAALLAAGYSLGSAIARVADRGSGVCAADLRRVRARIQQGIAESEALAEWADLAGVDALTRLVPVLALNRETTDLGRLLSDEARAIRRDVQRERIEQIERRSQQVWIPVTVATLVPGVIFLAVPFVEALRLFSGT